MAIPSFVNNGTVLTTGSATTVTPALPPTRVTNNILIAHISVQATGKTIAVSGGTWVIADSVNSGNISSAWAWCLVTGSEVTPTFSWTGAAAVLTNIQQFTGNATVSPIGNKNKATANSSTTLTVTSITSTADNSLIVDYLLASTNQNIPTPIDFTSGGVVSNSSGSVNIVYGPLPNSGSVGEALSVTITSANWASFGIELKGSGSASGNRERATQVVQETLLSYSNSVNLRATQVVEEILYTYSNPTNILATQVVLEVLRSVSSVSAKGNFGGII